MGQISGRLSWEVLTWEFLRGCIQVSAGAASSGGLIVAVGSASMMLTWQLGGGLGSSPCRPPCLGPLCNMAARFSQGVGSQRASQNPQCLLSPSLGSHILSFPRDPAGHTGQSSSQWERTARCMDTRNLESLGGSPWRLATTPVFAWSLAGTAGQFVSDKCQLCPSLWRGLTQPLPPRACIILGNGS